MSSETNEQFRSYRTFLDALYGVLIGFLIARLPDFRFLSLTGGGWPSLQAVLPFILLYLLYLLKLTLFWLGSRNSLKILCYYADYTFQGYHYLGAVLSALLVTQVVSSAVCDCSAVGSEAISTHIVYFLVWMSIGTALGDAIPTLAGVVPKIRDLIKSAQAATTSETRKEELAAIRQHYEGPIRRNGIINLAVVLLSWALHVPLWLVGVNPLIRLYSLLCLLVVLNTLQEWYLWRSREKDLRETLDRLAEKP